MVESIRTERLLLRRARAEDAVALHPIFTDPEGMRYWSTLPHENLAQTEEWLASMIDAPADTSDDFILDLDGRAIGKLGCWRLHDVGYMLGREHWGHGYAGEAMAAFLAHRRRMGSTEITADTDPGNLPSIRLLERHGFVETGRAENTWLIGGVWHHSIYWRKDL
ncbi:GNAT family N-acetyltransferase [Sphingomonas swuensis]|uniref:GNAT family N-acetyltransferase n=1 Tax=Sphingomonas swuensis TaxID=977800 RepID=A0ABP7T2U2_9SPHN